MEPRKEPDVRRLSTHILTGRLRFLDAIIAAGDRWSEVSAAVVGAENRAAARAAVAELLGADEMSARAVLDLRWEQLHQEARRSFRVERAATAAELATRTDTNAGPSRP